ncbi:hypothetical protein KP79_PYT15797 [Mizuhopecten yessoensis]|uniref:Uncharacterized protein n=1 Tax=Mizuhopecten yessoensis TaxID=6573 RepID=A0A210QY76_MIZYE|nr:hypothetical protein KP79_PYT15797 [Mizuhopecten yessoensis]
MNRKRKRGNVYITLRPGNIRYTQDTIANTMHVTNSKGHVTKMPLGEVADKVLRGDINIEAIPKISVFCLRNTWFSLDNRRLWVFKKLQCFLDNSRDTHFSITCLERDCQCVNMSKITTSNNGEDVVVRRDPGGSKWKQMEATITDKYPRKLNNPTGFIRTFTANSNMCGRGPLLSLPSNANNFRLDPLVIKPRIHPPDLCDAPPAYHPRRPRLLGHPDYLDMFPQSPEEPYFHGEEYIPEVYDEWYWRQADKYYSYSDENFSRPQHNFTHDFKFPKNIDIPGRRKAHGRRRVNLDEEEDAFDWLYRDF